MVSNAITVVLLLLASGHGESARAGDDTTPQQIAQPALPAQPAAPAETPARTAQDTGDPFDCGDLDGGRYGKLLKGRFERSKKLCDDGGIFSKQLQRIQDEARVCTNIAQQINRNSVPINLATMNYVQERLKAACGVYRTYIGAGLQACYVSRKGKTTVDRVGRAAAAATDDQQRAFMLLACVHGYNSGVYRNLGGIFNDTQRDIEAKLQNLSPGTPADANMKTFLDSIKGQIQNYVGFVGRQAGAKLQSREKIAADGNDPDSGMGAIRFNTQKDVDKFYDALLQCKDGVKSLDDFEAAYEKYLAGDLLAIKKDADRLKSDADAKSTQFSALSAENRAKADALGAAVNKNNGTPIVVSPNPAGGISRDVPDSLTDAQNKARAATFLLRSADNCSVGSGAKIETTGPNGEKNYYDLTAAHVTGGAGNKAHSPTDMAQGNVASPLDPKKQAPYGTPDAFDRKNDETYVKSAPGAALTPVASDKAIPQPGQRFIVSGSPGESYDGNYVQLNCTYVGAGPNGTLALDCPADSHFLGGMSGGPVVDSTTGQIWGVTSKQGTDYDFVNRKVTGRENLVFVSPISQDRNGQLVMGPSTNYSSNVCYATIVNPQPTYKSCWVSTSGTAF